MSTLTLYAKASFPREDARACELVAIQSALVRMSCLDWEGIANVRSNRALEEWRC